MRSESILKDRSDCHSDGGFRRRTDAGTARGCTEMVGIRAAIRAAIRAGAAPVMGAD